MIHDFTGLLPDDFSPESRVWIFQSNRSFTDIEELQINEQLLNYYLQWKSHGKEVKGWAKLLFNQFIVVLADESYSGVSGCSTDDMTRLIKSFERQYQVNFFDRMTLTFLVDGQAQPLPYNQVQYALEKGFIETDTPLFNNLVDRLETLRTEWLIPLNQSWLWKRLITSKVI
ncbi:MAG: hypothetical protein JNJ58_13855 [Chitinophagaceae bacterium]|nr:hypothetical protein [Chitinophagaceae bacterium]